MGILSVLFLIGALGTLGLFKVLNIPFSGFNIFVAIVLTVLFGTHMFTICLVVLGLLYIKEKMMK